MAGVQLSCVPAGHVCYLSLRLHVFLLVFLRIAEQEQKGPFGAALSPCVLSHLGLVSGEVQWA